MGIPPSFAVWTSCGLTLTWPEQLMRNAALRVRIRACTRRAGVIHAVFGQYSLVFVLKVG